MKADEKRALRAKAMCLFSAMALVACGGGGGDNADGATASRTGIQVVQPLSLSAAAVAPGQAVQMTASCSAGNGALHYQWDLGDGSASVTSTSATMHLSYAREGDFLPRVTCVDASGGSTVSTASAYLHVAVPTHTVWGLTLAAGADNKLDASATCTGTVGGNVTFTWDFGDGHRSSQTVNTPKASALAPSGPLSFTASHDYADAGLYTVKAFCADNLTVLDLAQNVLAAPQTVGASSTVMVGDNAGLKVTQALHMSANSPTTIAPVTFSMSCKATTGGTPKYTFVFGDGSPSVVTFNPWAVHLFAQHDKDKATAYTVSASCALESGFSSPQLQTMQLNVREPQLSLLAGDSTPSPFAYPAAVAVDGAGHLVVADAGNHAIFKVSPNGEVLTLAGGTQGFADGIGPQAQFNRPFGVAVDAKGNVFVADAGNNVVRKISAKGEVTTWGTTWLPEAGLPSNANLRFYAPSAVAIDGKDNVYVYESGNARALRRISPLGALTTLVDSMPMPGTTTSTSITSASNQYEQDFGAGGHDLAVAVDGTAYVGNASELYKVSPAGAVTSFIHGGGLPGRGLAVDAASHALATDLYAHAIVQFNAVGERSTLAGGAGAGFIDGTGPAARFFGPRGMVLGRDGQLFMVDAGNKAIRKISPAGNVSTVYPIKLANREGSLARFSSVRGVARDAAGNTYVADMDNNAVRKITPSGAVTTLAGGSPGFADGKGTDARFNGPIAIAVDPQGHVYVADRGNKAIRKIGPAGDVETWAGDGTSGSQDGKGQGARFSQPSDLVVDATGALYVLDGVAVRKVSPAREVSTLALPTSALGPAAFRPVGMALDGKGNLYLADLANHVIRKFSPALEVSSIGNGASGLVDGTGTVIQFRNPGKLTVDDAGNLYIADGDGLLNVIRKCEAHPNGSFSVTTVVGHQVVAGMLPGVQPGSIGLVQGIAISGRRLVFSADNHIGQVDYAP
jgi:streptogramin lyase